MSGAEENNQNGIFKKRAHHTLAKQSYYVDYKFPKDRSSALFTEGSFVFIKLYYSLYIHLPVLKTNSFSQEDHEVCVFFNYKKISCWEMKIGSIKSKNLNI